MERSLEVHTFSVAPVLQIGQQVNEIPVALRHDSLGFGIEPQNPGRPGGATIIGRRFRLIPDASNFLRVPDCCDDGKALPFLPDWRGRTIERIAPRG